MRSEIVPATPELLLRFYGRAPAVSMRAFVGIHDGEPLAVFGLYYDAGRMVLFSNIKPEARRFKKTLVAGAFMVRDLARSLGVPVHAAADCCVDGSVRLLERLGFKRAADDNLFILGDA